LLRLGAEAKKRGRFNIAFLCFFLLHRIEDCLSLLIAAGRSPEAAFLARTYAPSRVSDMVCLWRQNLEKISKRAAESLADPSEYGNLFPELSTALEVETSLKKHLETQGLPAASSYSAGFVEQLSANLIENFKLNRNQEQTTHPASVSSPATNTNISTTEGAQLETSHEKDREKDDAFTTQAKGSSASVSEAAATRAKAEEAAAAAKAEEEEAATRAKAEEEEAAARAKADEEAAARAKAAEDEAFQLSKQAAEDVTNTTNANEKDFDDENDDFLKEFEEDMDMLDNIGGEECNDEDLDLGDLDLDFE
jgi:coatomer subunit beta'